MYSFKKNKKMYSFNSESFICMYLPGHVFCCIPILWENQWTFQWQAQSVFFSSREKKNLPLLSLELLLLVDRLDGSSPPSWFPSLCFWSEFYAISSICFSRIYTQFSEMAVLSFFSLVSEVFCLVLWDSGAPQVSLSQMAVLSCPEAGFHCFPQKESLRC